MDSYAKLSFVMSNISGEFPDDLYVPRDSENSGTSDNELSRDDKELFDNGEPTESARWKFISTYLSIKGQTPFLLSVMNVRMLQ